MHILLRDNLEGYLSGTLPPTARRQFEDHLAGCAECREQLESSRLASAMVRELRRPEGVEFEPAPGFYARVIDRIEREREVPFWAMLLEPALGRRLAFACLMLLALLGAYVASLDQMDYPVKHRPEAILAGKPTPVPAPRIGPNLERNRAAILASLVTETD